MTQKKNYCNNHRETIQEVFTSWPALRLQKYINTQYTE